jgi:hypothetical protein
MLQIKQVLTGIVVFGLSSGVVVVEAEGQGKPDKEKQTSAQAQSKENLKKIALAMHDYHDVMGRFPPAAVLDKNKKPLFSWRVLLLPYVGERDLFKQFKLSEPWDSADNKKLLAKIPKVYAPVLGKSPEAGTTFYQVFTGKGTAFEGTRGLQITDFTDGTSNTILVIEAGEAVPWTKPADLAYDPQKPLPKLGGLFKDVIHIGTADGWVSMTKKGYSESALRLMITRNNGKPRRPLNPDE